MFGLCSCNLSSMEEVSFSLLPRHSLTYSRRPSSIKGLHIQRQTSIIWPLFALDEEEKCDLIVSLNYLFWFFV